eukprot:1092278-Amphidinium_carterae.2
MFETKLSSFSLGRGSYDALLQQRLQFHHPAPQNLPHSVALLKALVQVGGDHTQWEHAWLAELRERGTYIAAPSLSVPVTLKVWRGPRTFRISPSGAREGTIVATKCRRSLPNSHIEQAQAIGCQATSFFWAQQKTHH